jgi:hypothetical protein
VTELPDVVSAYFASAASDRVDALVATTPPDVVVADDGTTWEGQFVRMSLKLESSGGG